MCLSFVCLLSSQTERALVGSAVSRRWFSIESHKVATLDKKFAVALLTEPGSDWSLKCVLATFVLRKCYGCSRLSEALFYVSGFDALQLTITKACQTAQNFASLTINRSCLRRIAMDLS